METKISIMTTISKRLLPTACITAALIVTVVGCASTDKPAEDTLSSNAKEEAKILSVLDDMSKDRRYATWYITPEEGQLLRVLTEAVDAKHVVEIGTSNGYSALWFCLALRATGGKMTTHEIDPYRISMAGENFKRAGVSHLITIVAGDAHETVTGLREPIDILFIDADKAGYFDYLNKLLPLVRPGGLILAHDTTGLASEMQDYIKAVTANPVLETVFLYKHSSGLGVTLKKRQ